MATGASGLSPTKPNNKHNNNKRNNEADVLRIPRHHIITFPRSVEMAAYWNTPEFRANEAKRTLEMQTHIGTQHRRAVEVPFRDDTPMIGPPSCTAADFKLPRLRRCPWDPDDLVFEKRLEGGADGYVWKVRFGKTTGPLP